MDNLYTCLHVLIRQKFYVGELPVEYFIDLEINDAQEEFLSTTLRKSTTAIYLLEGRKYKYKCLVK